MRMYSISLSDSSLRCDGLGHYTSYGESCEVNGVRMVRLANGAILPRDNWFESRSDALRCVADQIERHARLLLQQAGDLREQAQHLEVAS